MTKRIISVLAVLALIAVACSTQIDVRVSPPKRPANECDERICGKCEDENEQGNVKKIEAPLQFSAFSENGRYPMADSEVLEAQLPQCRRPVGSRPFTKQH